MKVLHIPNNIASQMNITVKALRDIGIDARGLAFSYSAMQDNRFIEHFPLSRNIFTPSGAVRWAFFAHAVMQAIHWADIVHWHFNTPVLPFNLDLRYTAHLKKGRVVECWGSDIRIPEIAAQDNPYIAAMYQTYPNLAHGRQEQSLRTQKRFAQYGFNYLLADFEISTYIQKDLFPAPYKTAPRILVEEFTPQYPPPNKKRPLLVHAPSRMEFKGTKKILEIIEGLKKEFQFDFQLLQGIPHPQLLKYLKDCDICIDELIFGSYGLTAIEAMALGKPCITYIKPAVLPHYPSPLPIVNANPDNFKEVLSSLLRDSPKRTQIGRLSREYIEKHHDAHKIAKDLVKIYHDVLSRQGNKTL